MDKDIILCDIFGRQPCRRYICCRTCEKYEQCRRRKCENDPKKCGGFKEREKKNDELRENKTDER